MRYCILLKIYTFSGGGRGESREAPGRSGGGPGAPPGGHGGAREGPERSRGRPGGVREVSQVHLGGPRGVPGGPWGVPGRSQKPRGSLFSDGVVFRGPFGLQT